MTKFVVSVCIGSLLLVSCTFSPVPQDSKEMPGGALPPPTTMTPPPQTETAPVTPNATVTDNLATPAPADTTTPDSPVSDVVSLIGTQSSSTGSSQTNQ